MSTYKQVYQLVDYADASADVRSIYDETKAALGIPFVLNWFKCQGDNYNLLRGNWEKLRNTLLAGDVPNILKQLIIYNVSAEKGCTYCARAHAIFANSMGKALSNDASFKITDNLHNFPTPSSYSVAVKIVTKAALTPGEINEDDFEELAGAGFSVREIKELMAQADLVNMLNTIADVSKIKIDNELLEIEG